MTFEVGTRAESMLIDQASLLILPHGESPND